MKKLYRILRILIKKIISDGVINQSAQLAFYLLLSFFPFVILLVGLIGRLSVNNTYVINLIAGFLPSVSKNILLDNAQHIANASIPSVISLSAVICIWHASKSVRTVIFSLNHAFSFKKKRNYFISILYSVMHTVIVLVFASAVIVVVFYTREFNVRFNLSREAISLIRILSIFIIGFLALTTMYKFFPYEKVPFRATLPGAAAVAITWGLSYTAFAFYCTHFWQYNKFYGSLGALVVFLIWMYIVSFILLVGGEINSIFLKISKKN